MSDIAIRVEELSKQFRIGAPERYRTLRDTLTDALTAPFHFRRNGHKSTAGAETIWALKDVSFEVKSGEVIGIIGRNGAGKSTLLKILSRITEPTEGRAEIHGRVGSLLEVGTGFHPELTGRENIFLNGAILGMKKAEILRKFDEIVAFAEVEKFIDTPVKHYSSGMHVRLAFAVAAHLDLEIMIVDEVLAVGDADFQKKCLSKLGRVANQCRAIVLVSHQLNQIRRICSKALWLEGGRIHAAGPTNEVLNAYESSSLESRLGNVRDSRRQRATFTSWHIIRPGSSAHTHACDTIGPVNVRFLLDVQYPIHRAFHGIALYRSSDRLLIWGHGSDGISLVPGRYQFVYKLDMLPLKPGGYQWLVTLADDNGCIDQWESVPELAIATRPSNNALDDWSGVINVPFTMEVDPIPSDWTAGTPSAVSITV